MQKNSSSFEPGEIVVADILYSAQAGIKKRPVLVISNAKHNNQSANVIVLSISSTELKTPYDVALTNKDLVEGELITESKILCDFPTTLEKTMVPKKIGKIRKEKLDETKKKIKELYEL